MKVLATFCAILPLAVGRRPDHANGNGPPNHAGEQGPPNHANGRGPPDHVLEKFREMNGVKPGAQLFMQELGPNNSIKFSNGDEVSLDGLEPLSVFSPGAKCWEGDKKIDCPETTVFTRAVDHNGSKVVVAKDKSGKIIKVRKKKLDGDSETLHAIEGDDNEIYFASLPDDAVDEEFFASFVMRNKDVQERRGRELGRGIAKEVNVPMENRKLQSTCTQFREIELAVAVESSFCAQIGASNIDAKVQSIVADMASDYEQNNLCFTVAMVHYEKHCNANNDPYKQGVQLNQSGCGGYGLLDFFEDYWNANRQGVQRDSVQLFSGTGLECDNDGCVIGCAYTQATCLSTFSAYGVNWVGYTSNAVAQSQLVSHELGHNVGANHDSGSRDFIMFPVNGANERFFSSQSIASFTVSRNENCLDLVGANAPTPAPTPSPTPPPGPTNPPPSGTFAIQIQVTHDDYPEETSWELLDSNGNVLESQSTNSGVSAGNVVTVNRNAAAGTYKFTINDTYGDGNCCGHGQGGYTVTVDGKQVASGGNFEFSDGVTFTVGVSSFTASSLAASTGTKLEYAMVLSGSTNSVACSISGSNGDADLYVSMDDANTVGGSSGGDCVPYIGGSNENCPTSEFPTIGDVLMVTVHAYETFSGVTLTCNA